MNKDETKEQESFLIQFFYVLSLIIVSERIVHVKLVLYTKCNALKY